MFTGIIYLFIVGMTTNYRYITETKLIIIEEFNHQEFRDVYQIKYRFVDIDYGHNSSTGLYIVKIIPHDRVEALVLRRNNISREFVIGNMYEITILPVSKGIRSVPVLVMMKDVYVK
jgi:hypothetical protein